MGLVFVHDGCQAFLEFSILILAGLLSGIKAVGILSRIIRMMRKMAGLSLPERREFD